MTGPSSHCAHVPPFLHAGTGLDESDFVYMVAQAALSLDTVALVHKVHWLAVVPTVPYVTPTQVGDAVQAVWHEASGWVVTVA